MDIAKAREQIKSHRLAWILFIVLVVILVFLLTNIKLTIPIFIGDDWYSFFRPACLAVLSGHSPYSVDGFFSPPWLLIFLVPFSLLPPPFDLISLIIVDVVSIVIVLRKMKAPMLVTVLFLLTPLVWGGILCGNIDCLAALGFILPPQIGMILLLSKPQIGAAVVVYWVIEAWRKGGLREVVKICTPFGVLVILSFLLFGGWPVHMVSATSTSWNISDWPFLLPVGLVLLVKAIRDHKQGLAITAGLFLSPYVEMLSIPYAILGFLQDKALTIAAILGLWVAFLVKGFG